MEKQSNNASTERKLQTTEFTVALDKLGNRFETKMDAQTVSMASSMKAQTDAMTKAAYLAATVVTVMLIILGSIAGAVTYFKGSGFEAGSNGGHPPFENVEKNVEK